MSGTIRQLTDSAHTICPFLCTALCIALYLSFSLSLRTVNLTTAKKIANYQIRARKSKGMSSGLCKIVYFEQKRSKKKQSERSLLNGCTWKCFLNAEWIEADLGWLWKPKKMRSELETNSNRTICETRNGLFSQ